MSRVKFYTKYLLFLSLLKLQVTLNKNTIPESISPHCLIDQALILMPNRQRDCNYKVTNYSAKYELQQNFGGLRCIFNHRFGDFYVAILANLDT